MWRFCLLLLRSEPGHFCFLCTGDSGFCIFRSGRGADAATERGDDDNDLQSNSSFAAVSSTASSPAGASDRSFDEVCRRHQREHHSASTPTTPSLSPASDRASPSAHSPSPRHGSGGGNHSVHQHHSRENGDNDSDDDDDHSPRVAAAWDRSPALPFPNPLQHASSVGCASGSPSMRRVSSHHGLARVRDETDADAEPAPSSEDAHQDGGKQAAEQSTANDHGDELRLPPLFAQFSGWDSDENAPQTVFSSVWSPPPTPRRDAFTNELLRSRVELLSAILHRNWFLTFLKYTDTQLAYLFRSFCAFSARSRVAGLSFSPIPLVPIFSVDRMQHAFNFPFQLTSLRTLLEFAPPAGKTVDTPDEALSGFIRLQIGGALFLLQEDTAFWVYEMHTFLRICIIIYHPCDLICTRFTFRQT